MNTIKERSKKESLPKKYEVDFKPNLNGTYTITFEKAAENAGFTILLKGGLFHTFPEGYVVTKHHRDLLDKAGIPYKIVK